MATGQTLLDTMEDLDDELQNQSSEADVARSLRAINRAQDLLELLIASQPFIFGTWTTVSTTASQDYTDISSKLFKRIDRVHFIDPATSNPKFEIMPHRHVGDLLVGSTYENLLSPMTGTTGEPRWYTLYGDNVLWDPTPDAIHTVRIYGFEPKADITAGGTFRYPDEFLWPMAATAVRMYQIRIHDPQETQQFAMETFSAIVSNISGRWRDGATEPRYSNFHTE